MKNILLAKSCCFFFLFHFFIDNCSTKLSHQFERESTIASCNVSNRKNGRKSSVSSNIRRYKLNWIFLQENAHIHGMSNESGNSVVIYNYTGMEAMRTMRGSRGAKSQTINVAVYCNFTDVMHKSITINGFPETFRSDRLFGFPTLPYRVSCTYIYNLYPDNLSRTSIQYSVYETCHPPIIPILGYHSDISNKAVKD